LAYAVLLFFYNSVTFYHLTKLRTEPGQAIRSVGKTWMSG